MSTKPFLTLPSSVAEVIDLTQRLEPPGPETANEQKTAWPEMDKAAYYGLAGDVVKTIDPHTEADPVAILLQLLTGFGNLAGNNPFYRIEGDRHHANLFLVLVGATSKARKGTSAGRVRQILSPVDELWRCKGGLSSGEGLIDQIKDEIKKWDPKNKTFEVVDPGVTDKRLLVAEAEFAAVLRVCERHGNSLPMILRNAWDSLTLETMVKHSPLKATNPHISIAGHITEEELRMNLTRTDMASGSANRFIYALVKRSKLLPDGGNLSDQEIMRLSILVKDAATFAKQCGRVTMTDETRKLWETIYKDLSEGQPGLLGAIVARGEAQVTRSALVYALLDKCERIDMAHLNGAIAVWEYCEASAAHIFGKLIGDPTADEILRALRQAPIGISRTALRDMFSRNLSGGRLGAALDLLRSRGLARMEMRETGGRPLELWFAEGQA
jgi:hypothetical protein